MKFTKNEIIGGSIASIPFILIFIGVFCIDKVLAIIAITACIAFITCIFVGVEVMSKTDEEK